MKRGVFIFFVAVNFSAFGQDRHAHKDLTNYHVIKKVLPLEDRGVIIKTGHAVDMGKQKTSLFSFSTDGELVWEKEVKSEYAHGKTMVVTDPSGEVVYNIAISGTFGKDFSGKTHYITQVKKNGQLKSFELEGKEEFGKSLQTAFCDDQYLFYLATQNGDEEKDNKKAEDKLILNRFSHEGLSYKRFVLDLPLIAAGDNSTFWSYVGENDGQHYLVAKLTDEGLGKNIFEVVSFNSDGQVGPKLSISVALNNKFTRPAWNVSLPDPVFQRVVDLDFNEKTVRSTAPNMGSSSYSTYVYTAGAFGYFLLDAKNNCFYSYGLFGPTPFKKLGPVYDGFYIIKYDLEGKEQWRLQQQASSKLMNEKQFRIHGAPHDREVGLSVLPDGRLNFSIHFVKSLFDFDISADGKFLGERNSSDVFVISNNVFNSSEGLKSDAFKKADQASGKSKKVTYETFLTPSGEILIRFSEKEWAFDLYYFKK